MNATERDQLQQFLNALRQTRAEPKDPTADAMIREAVASQADAAYLLVQRAMGLGLSLDAAQVRLQQLEAQCAQLQVELQAAKAQQGAQQGTQAPASSSFLMSGAQAWGRAAEPAVVPTAQTAAFSSAVATSRPMSPPPVAAPAAVAAPPAASAWGGGLMAQVATTAAGVVAGGLLFQGVQSLMGHNNHSPAPTSPASPLSDATQEPLPGLVSPLAAASDPVDADESSWDQGDDWA